MGTRYQGGIDLSLAWASRKRERKSRELVVDSSSEGEESGALLRSAIRASPNPTMGFMRTDLKRWRMGFFAHSPSTQGICEIYIYVKTQIVLGTSRRSRLTGEAF